jgi:hypothetical protein
MIYQEILAHKPLRTGPRLANDEDVPKSRDGNGHEISLGCLYRNANKTKFYQAKQRHWTSSQTTKGSAKKWKLYGQEVQYIEKRSRWELRGEPDYLTTTSLYFHTCKI